MIVIAHFLWHLVNLSQNYSNLQSPLCLPGTQNNSKKQTQLQPHILGSDVEGLMKYPVPINLSPGGAGDREHLLNAPNRGHLSLLES